MSRAVQRPRWVLVGIDWAVDVAFVNGRPVPGEHMSRAVRRERRRLRMVRKRRRGWS